MAENKVEKIEKLIQDRLKIKEINRDATIVTYGLDSLDVMEFLLDLESEFGITFESEEVKDLKTVGQLEDLIVKKVK